MIDDSKHLREPELAPIAKEIEPQKKFDRDLIAKSVQEYSDKLCEQGLFSGAILVAVGDEIAVARYHSLDETRGVHFDEHTLFNSCSVSKLFTAISIHQLASLKKRGQEDTII